MVPACEILHLNSAVRSLIRDNKNHQIDNIIASGVKEGMCSMDRAIASLCRDGKIALETALEYADNPEQLKRFWDKKFCPNLLVGAFCYVAEITMRSSRRPR